MKHGSLHNLMMSQTSSAPTITVGMGATHVGWSDRHAYTVIAVESHGKRLVLQRDKARRTDKNGMSEDQSYLYEPDPEGQVVTVSLRRDGRYIEVGCKDSPQFHIGHRREYHDYSF